MGKEGEELTEQETAIYDRQIRVWGVDAQRRIIREQFLYPIQTPLCGIPLAIAVPWRSLPKRTSKLHFAMRVIERFEVLEKRNPQDTSADDLPNVLELRKELCKAECINESRIPDPLLQRLLAARVEFPPVCAIIGGVLGQEVIKSTSGKGDPLKNFFLFDAMDDKGIIDDVSNINS